MKYVKCFIPFGIITFIFAGCTNGQDTTIRENKEQQAIAQVEETKESDEIKESEITKEPETNHETDAIQEETKTLPFGFLNYTGYLDECYVWQDYMLFVDCDYDNDGLTDRVYRTYLNETEFCHYRFEFGNGDILDIEKDVWDVGEPEVIGVDLSADGVNEIVVYLTPAMSNEPRAFGDIVVYEKKNGTYQQSVLPFIESKEGYSQNLELVFNQAEGQAIEVVVPQTGFTCVVPIETELWEVQNYKNHFTTGETFETVVWSYGIACDGDEKNLVCKIHLFDKWSVHGLDVVLDYQKEKFEIKEIVYCEDEFDFEYE